MSFVKFITNTPEDYGQALQVSGFVLKSEQIDVAFTKNLARNTSDTIFVGANPVPVGALLSSGNFYNTDPSIAWSLVNPYNNKILNSYNLEDLNIFEGYDLYIKDEAGTTIKTITR